MGVKLSLNKLGFRFDLDFFKRLKISFSVSQFLFGVEETIGIRNNTSDGKRLIFLDYDQILFDEMLLPELKYLQEKYELSDFYVFKSSQKPFSFHAVCFDKVNVSTWKDVVEESSCDDNYKKPALKDFRTAVLRIAPKGSSNAPTFFRIVRSPFVWRVKSLAHYNFFKFNYDIPVKKIDNFDKSDKVILVDYGTLNYLKKDLR